MRPDDKCKGSENGRHNYQASPFGKVVCTKCGLGPLKPPMIVNLMSSATDAIKMWSGPLR